MTITATLPPRTRLLLEAPILPTLLRLAAPNIGEAVARITFLTADALFVSWLGSDALAAVSVVFPLLMLLQTATAAGFGAGVSSSIGRALGAGDLPRARSLAGTSIALALVGWALIATPLLLGGPALYAAMGLKGAALDMAILYGALVFGGSIFVWLMNIMANVSRGAGTMVVPASAIMIGEAFHVALSPALIMGWGPFPTLGIAGAAIAVLSAYVVGTAVLAAYLCSRHALVRLEPALIRLKRAETNAILKVGAVAARSHCNSRPRHSLSPAWSAAWAAWRSRPTARRRGSTWCNTRSPSLSAQRSSPWSRRPQAPATTGAPCASPGQASVPSR